MRSIASHADPMRGVRVGRKRRPFGLDAPRPPDVRRTEAAIGRWLDTHMPDALVLRIAAAGPAEPAATLVLLLPAARIALLRIEAGPEPERPDDRRLAAACAARRIPWAVVRSVEDTRAALRRLGHEPQPARSHAED